jgi:tetratricopeptide (TPR) repeat protein
MSRKIIVDPAEPSKSGAPEGESNGHFDGVEAQFFEQGQDSMLLVADGDYFADQEDPSKGKWFALSRPFFMGLAVGGMLGAILVGVVAWRMPGPAVTSEPVALKQSTQEGVAMVPPPDADTRDLGQAAEPAAFVAKVLPPTRATALPSPTNAIPVAEKAMKTASPAVDPAKPSFATAAAAQPADDDAQRACRKAIADKQRNRILITCEAALAANPRAVEFAVALAKTEFDRGRIAQALDWSKKAIAVDPDVADPYVFIGEAEQNAGHKRAAKDAYMHYLRLAPSGRYAADLRAVLRSL